MNQNLPMICKQSYRLMCPVLVAASLSIALLATPALAKPAIPQNLGNGLARILEQYENPNAQTLQTANNAGLAIRDGRDRILVDIYLNGRLPIGTVRQSLERKNGARIIAENSRYQAGVLEVYVPLGLVREIAALPGVSSVVLVLKPVADVGLTTSQGVVQHRVDQLPAGIDGSGITVAALSDSYNTTTGPIRAANDIASGDLPGAGNPLGNTQPVVVLAEFPGGSDEGRAMLQIIHDMAPQAKLCFATAFTGQVSFGNNIRDLANPALGCGATVIVDDIIYFDEPFFSDGIVARAVDDVAAQGVSYFSSAGNRPPTQAYFSDVRIVAGESSSLAGTNINLANVDPALYAGGFHDFNPDPVAVDVAQNIALTGGGTISFQWDDPFDVAAPTLGATLLNTTGTVTAAAPIVSFPLTVAAAQQISITSDANPASPNPIPDSVLTLKDPQGRVLASVDGGTNPENLLAFLPTAGTYTIEVSGFGGATGGFTLLVQEAFGVPRVTTDFNLLFFDTNGNFLFSANDNNLVSNRPIETLGVSGTRTVQLVVARANTPPAIPTPASRIRYVWFTSGSPQEYFSYTAPVTFGHNSARGAIGTAAYSAFAPYIPEAFESTGPGTFYFDSNNNRLAVPEVRLKPDVAAMDGANNTFFSADSASDPDSFPNFFGTSAAAPHAAAIAALVLDANGGPNSVTPTQMRTILQRSAFLHDLDPYFASATIRVDRAKIFISGTGDGSNTSSFDTNFFRVAFAGGGTLQTLSLNAQGGNTTQATPGLVFDIRPPAVGFPFTLGTLSGITAADITAAFSQPGVPPAVANQFSVLTINIAPGALRRGESFGFGVDRDEARNSNLTVPAAAGGNSADQLGANVLIPAGTIAPGGVTITGTLSSGTQFTGTFVNQIGVGYSILDGFGFINAQNAVSQPLP